MWGVESHGFTVLYRKFYPFAETDLLSTAGISKTAVVPPFRTSNSEPSTSIFMAHGDSFRISRMESSDIWCEQKGQNWGLKSTSPKQQDLELNYPLVN